MNKYVLTLYLDWAPECAIDYVADILIKNKLKATWFITHNSPAVQRLYGHHDLFEFGIHPNFLPNSSHGKTEREVLDSATKLLPNSKIMRTHALVQSSYLLTKAVHEYGIQIDVSLLLPGTPNIQPHTFHFNNCNNSLLRIPYFWEDDVEISDPRKSWDVNHPKYHISGLKIFDFHPTFNYLNSDNLSKYHELID